MKEQFYLEELIERYPKLAPVSGSVARVYEMIRDAYASGHKLLIAGNGGSGADAEHIAGELMKSFVKPRLLSDEMAARMKETDAKCGEWLAGRLQNALPAIALTGHPALSTAVINDLDGRLAFAQQVWGFGQEGDVFLGISTSGNAENVYLAGVAAKARGMKIAALTGRDGGRLARIADAAVIVPEQETYKIQELHLPVYHTLCLMLEEHFF